MFRKIALGTVLALAAGITVGCDSGATKPGDKNATGKSNMMANAAKERSDAFEKAGKKASEATAKAVEKGKEVGEKVAEGADKVAEALRTSTLAPITEKLKAITDKVNGLTGDAGTKAKAALADLNKLIEGFKAAPADKLKELVQPLKDKFAEVSKLVGL